MGGGVDGDRQGLLFKSRSYYGDRSLGTGHGGEASAWIQTREARGQVIQQVGSPMAHVNTLSEVQLDSHHNTRLHMITFHVSRNIRPLGY